VTKTVSTSAKRHPPGDDGRRCLGSKGKNGKHQARARSASAPPLPATATGNRREPSSSTGASAGGGTPTLFGPRLAQDGHPPTKQGSHKCPTHSHPVPQSGKRLRMRALVALCASRARVWRSRRVEAPAAARAPPPRPPAAPQAKAGGANSARLPRRCGRAWPNRASRCPARPAGATRQPGGPGAGSAQAVEQGGLQLPKGRHSGPAAGSTEKSAAPANFPRGQDRRLSTARSAPARALSSTQAMPCARTASNVPAPNTTGKRTCVQHQRGSTPPAASSTQLRASVAVTSKAAFPGGGARWGRRLQARRPAHRRAAAGAPPTGEGSAG